MTPSSSSRPRAVVTGASSGIGAAFAARLAADQYNLILVARREDRLNALAEKLRQQFPVEVEVVAADLSSASDLHMLEARIAADDGLAILVNNAGFGAYMPFVDVDPDLAQAQIMVQVIAVMRLTRAALPGMIARKRGDVINVSSRLAFSGVLNLPRLPKRVTYAATKAFINTFTQVLHHELEGTGVRVQALCPGVVRTDFHEVQGIDSARFPPEIVMEPEDVVNASLAGLRLGEVICIPGLDDLTLLATLEDAQRHMVESSTSGKAAKRYQS